MLNPVISWILKVGERLRAGDEYQLRQLVPLFQVYLSDIMRNNLNSRRLAYIVAQMLYWLKVDMAEENAKTKKAGLSILHFLKSRFSVNF